MPETVLNILQILTHMIYTKLYEKNYLSEFV